MKLLTVGLVLVTAAVAGCSSTTGSSGAVQNDVTANPMPSPEFSPSAGTSAGPVASASPTLPPIVSCTNLNAPRSDSSSSPPSPAEPIVGGSCHPPAPKIVACDPGMQYACGDIGQSGVGTVFYASTASFACGANMESSCNYLEVAPNGWNGKLFKCKKFGCGGERDETSDWGGNKRDKTKNPGDGYDFCGSQTSGGSEYLTVVGSGYTNTSAMLTRCKPGTAGEIARSYNGGGMTDWSLPSKDELNALYYYPNRNIIGGFAAAAYWSSSYDAQDMAIAQDFNKGAQNVASSACGCDGVRAVRAF